MENKRDQGSHASSKPRISSSSYLAHQHRLQECLCALRVRGWEQRLVPLAQHMAQKHLVRSRHAGAPLRHLDRELLRTALCRLLTEQWEDGCLYLVFQLIVDDAEPALLAAERGVSRPALVELLRDAVDELAIMYEDVAYGSQEQVQEQGRVAGQRQRASIPPPRARGLSEAQTAAPHRWAVGQSRPREQGPCGFALLRGDRAGAITRVRGHHDTLAGVNVSGVCTR